MDIKSITSHIAADILSNLPCNVIDEILMCMPIRDAVRTSILSREWRYKLQTIPNLVFDQNLERSLNGYPIESVIYQVLLHHKGSIVKFEVNGGPYSVNALYKWLHFLSNHRIEELKLRFPLHSATLKGMPHYLFTFDQLRHLVLVNCNLSLPSSFKGFRRLVRLDFDYVVTTSGDFSRFISNCPMLEHLTLHHNEFEDLEIDAPNLKSFSLNFRRDKFTSICFKNTPLLEEFSEFSFLNGYAPIDSFQGFQNLDDLFGQIISIKKLKLSTAFLQLLASCGMVEKLDVELSQLTVLHLGIDLEEIDQLTLTLCLIRSSPNLQTLEIEIFGITVHAVNEQPAAQFLREQEKDKLITLGRLKKLKINKILGTRLEMEFVKLLLSIATALVKLEIVIWEGTVGNKRIKRMKKELAKFLHRISSTAEITFVTN